MELNKKRRKPKRKPGKKKPSFWKEVYDWFKAIVLLFIAALINRLIG
jgi:hypothetical protein